MFYLGFKKQKKSLPTGVRSGFSLIELLVVIAIFTIVTGIILVNIPNFKESGSLDLTAQQIATYIRGAQIYAQSTFYKKSGNTKYPAYGIHFEKNNQNFFLFPSVCALDANACSYDTSLLPLENYRISDGFYISNLLLNKVPAPSFITSVDIIFRRPKQGATFSFGGNISIITLQLSSKSTNRKKCINIYKNGQISVQNPTGDPTANCS